MITSIRRHLTASALGLALVVTGFCCVTGTALANTRANANTYMSQAECINVVPGDCSGFIAGKGLLVWMNCWEGGP